MSADQESDDKSFEPSQQKLDDARKKGEIARSADLTTAAAYSGFLLVCMTLGGSALIQLGTELSLLLNHATDAADAMFSGSPSPLMGSVIGKTAFAMAPWFGVPAAMAILAIIAQRSFIVTPSKLAPKLSRISPISGAKNKFGRQGLFEFAKSTVKLLIYCTVMAVFLTAQRDRIIASINLSPGMIVAELGRLITGLMFVVVVVAATIGMVDFIWQQAEHIRKNRMSRKELMDEHKQAEGDPHMKQQRRQKGTAIAMNQMLGDIPTADVVIVNPTHYAVALKWDKASGQAPICVAKGVDEVAARIRELAHEHAVPIQADPPTARALHAGVEIGAEISPEHYAAVAAAIRFAEDIRRRARGR